MSATTKGTVAALVESAREAKDALDEMGAGIAIFGIGDEHDADRWAVAIVIGPENVDALSAWHDEQAV